MRHNILNKVESSKPFGKDGEHVKSQALMLGL